MDHDKSGSRDRKAFYIAPLITALVVAGLVGVIVWRQPPASQPVKAPERIATPPLPVKSAVAPASPAVLERADLLTAAERAASDYAAGLRSTSSPDPLKGRRFALELAFGCNGANGAMLNPQTTVFYDAAQASLTLTAQPGLWSSLPLMQPLLDAGQAEAVEGFWVPRPWTTSESCPPASNEPPPAIATPASAQTVGLAQIFAPGSARTLRHSEHPYSLTRKLPPDDADLLSHSYHLILEGVITGYPDGRSLHCWSESPEHHPICVFAVTFDRVAFQDAVSGQVLASWSD
jgi:hypothetical protein